MASLQNLKSRISSVSTTKKITKAMQLVATAKLQKARKNLNFIQEYYSSVYDMFQDLLVNVKDISKIFPQNPQKSTIYILITSDIGLCGGYNANVFKILKNEIKHDDKLIIIGTKGVLSLGQFKVKVIQKFSHVGDEPNYMVASDIAKEVIPQFFSGLISHVKLVHTRFVNTVISEATITQLLPIVKSEKNSNQISAFQNLTEFEPSAEEVLKNAIPIYISAIIYGAQVESKVSEMSSRRNAMENASDNADELINSLELEYNRLRQATITQEIAEIVAGSEIE